MPENGEAKPEVHPSDVQLPPGVNPGHHIMPTFADLAGVFREHTEAMDRLTEALKKSSFSEEVAGRLAVLEAKSGSTS